MGRKSASERSEASRESGRKWRAADPMHAYLIGKASTARRAGLEWTITREQVEALIPKDGLCPVMRRPLVMPGEPGPMTDRLSLDQLRPGEGYVPGNVAVLSHRANGLKAAFTDGSTLRRLADWIEANVPKGLGSNHQG